MRLSCRYQKIVGLIFLCSIFTLSATAVRLEVVGNELDVRFTTEAVIQQELDWRFTFDSNSEDVFRVIVMNTEIDSQTFAPKSLYQITLGFIWHDVQTTRTIAFLVNSVEDWQSVYAANLTRLIRLNLGKLWVEAQTNHITHALDSGYWTTSSLQLKGGQRVWIKGVSTKPVAIMEVVDLFNDPEEGGVTELRPVWASRPIASGMPLEKLTADYPMELSGNFSLQQYGLGIGVNFPLWVGPFRLSSRLTVDAMWDEPIYEVLIHLGLKTQLSLGAFSSSSDNIGKWWSNIQIAAGVHMGIGVAWQGLYLQDFIYGANADLQLLYQSSSHLYWGVAVGYHQRVKGETNVGEITLSPTLGWLW